MTPHLTLPIATLLQSAEGVDWLSVFAQNLSDLTTQHGDALTQFGMTELSFIALVMLVGMVIRWSTATMSFQLHHHEPVRVGDLVNFMLRLIFCLLAENYWTNPLPGTSFGLNHLFSYLAEMISQSLDQQALSNLQQTLKSLADNTVAPALTAPTQLLCYLLIQIVLFFSSSSLFLTNVSGFILYAVAALFGPVFIPLYLTNTFRGKFLSFIDVLVGLAMIRAVATAFIYVWGGFMNTFIERTFHGDYSMTMWIANLVPVLATLMAFDLSLLYIPSLTQSIFGGNAGIAGRLEQAAGKIAAKLP